MEILNITNENFEEEVLNFKGIVVLDFWATWCGPCKALGPILVDFAAENSNIKVGKVNVDNESEIASKFRIMSIPTLIIFKDGEIANKSVGLISKEQIVKLTNI